ncbi:MAG: hypothetical protein R2828_17795 [Saprospiraceae bacterium]
MIDPQNIDEQALIEQGLRMKANGLGSTFVYKFIRDKIEDPEIRGRILEAINRPAGLEKGRTNPKALSEDGKKEARELRIGKYKYEDYLEAVQKLRLIGFGFLFLGTIFLLSSYSFRAASLPHAVTSLFGGAFVLLVYKSVSWDRLQNIYVGIGVFLLAILLEYLAFGLPDPVIPRLGEIGNRVYVNFITITNSVSPLIYFGAKVAFSYLFFMVWYTRSQVEKMPLQIRRRLGEKV